jgi:hypothetical protein
MDQKAAAEERFDAILRRMLQFKPLSRSEISAMIEALSVILQDFRRRPAYRLARKGTGNPRVSRLPSGSLL